jgi:hypothetical protein
MTRVLFLAMLIACGGNPAPVAEPTHAAAGDSTCPLEVPGTSVAVEDTTEGASLVFVTTGKVDDVRVRAKQLADAINQRSAPAGSLAAMMPKASATAADIDGGSRVTLSAGDAGKLQSEIRMHANHLSAGSCKMAM